MGISGARGIRDCCWLGFSSCLYSHTAQATHMAALPSPSTGAAASPLVLQGIIGFSGMILKGRYANFMRETVAFQLLAGSVPSGLKWHPDGRYVAYPLGSTIVVKDTSSNKQVFLSGHTDRITAVAMSPDGRFLASGQRTNMGFKVCSGVGDCRFSAFLSSLFGRLRSSSGTSAWRSLRETGPRH